MDLHHMCPYVVYNFEDMQYHCKEGVTIFYNGLK